MQRPIKVFLVSVLSLLLIIIFLKFFEVDNTITPEDSIYIEKYLDLAEVAPLPVPRTYESEKAFIEAVQRSVLARVHGNVRKFKVGGVEPKDLYETQSALCFGRSRVIEKVLRSSGFQTRHISLYSTEKTGSKIKSLFTRGTSSHAITEVLTKKGWLVIDSNDPWLSLDHQNNPISLIAIQARLGKELIPFNASYLPHMNRIYNHPFTFVYGLYSRHGTFYPPYGFFPDVNYREFIFNLIDR